MSTLTEIKAAAEQVSVEDRHELLRWLADSEEMRQRELVELRQAIAIGVEQADRGELGPLDMEEIKAEGRRRKGMLV